MIALFSAPFRLLFLVPPCTAWWLLWGIFLAHGIGYGMLCRLALGHAGRPLQAGKPLVAAFCWAAGYPAAAGDCRGSAGPDRLGSPACLWALAFSLYFWRLVPVLPPPRGLETLAPRLFSGS